jgi:hypothetical protein
MRTRAVAIIMFVIFLTWFGVAAGRWMNRVSESCEQRYQTAIDNLRNQ